MKLTKSLNLMVLGAVVAIIASGCATHRGTINPLHRPPQPPPVAENPIIDTTPLSDNDSRVNRNPVNPVVSPVNRTGDDRLGKAPSVTDDDRIKSRQIADAPPAVPIVNNTPVDPLTNLHPLVDNNDQNWPQDREALRTQTVYFDFDKSTVKAGEESKISAVASYLRSNPASHVLIEGNCDERGTEEYNRSLGERRALATREILIRLGVETGRISTITYGEDRPAEAGHNESAWSKNRRDEFVVLNPPKP